MAEEPKNIDLFNSAILISAITGDIYLSAFEYEQGYGSFFHVPDYLIEVSLTNILSIAASALLLFLLIFNTSGLFIPVVNKIKSIENQHLRSSLGATIGAFFVAFFILIVFPFSHTLLYAIIGVLVGSNISAWILSTLLSLRSKAPITAGAQIIHESNQKYSAWYYFFDKIERKYILPLIMFILLPFFMWLFGQGTAMKQKNFECITGHKNILVIRKYGDLLICNSPDSVHKTPGKEITIIKISDKNAISLTQITTGPFVEGN